MLILDENQRQCPYCDDVITYKKKHQAMSFAGKPCRLCSFKEKLKKHYRSHSCPYCSLELKMEDHFLVHLKKIHGIPKHSTIEDAYLIFNQQSICECGCGSPTTFLSWHDGYQNLLKGHLPAEAKEKKNKNISEALMGSESWCKGKTKETDSRVAARGIATGIGRKKALDEKKFQIWSTGKTKETDSRVALAAKNLQEKYEAKILVPWAKGMSKDTDERIMANAEYQSAMHKNGIWKAWHKGQNVNTDPRILKKAENAIAKNATLGWDYPTRMSLDEVKERLSHLTEIHPVDPTFSNYKNWLLKNLEFKCNKCGTTSLENIQTASSNRCRLCTPFGSMEQRNLYNLIVNKFGFKDAVYNNRVLVKGCEFDITIPSRRLAIEFNGIYYHSEAINKDPYYHQTKKEKADNIGYQLIHIFEDEWNEKEDIILSLLAQKLGCTSEKISARKCKVVELDHKTRRDFFQTYHLEGDTNAKYAIGLVDSNDIVIAAMSVRSPFHSKSYSDQLEVARFCIKGNTSCVGALSRLSKYCYEKCIELGYTNLMTYVDERVGNGKGYLASGWIKTGVTNRRFWWTDFRKRYNRFKFRATKNKTEKQVAEDAGVYKIWGCSNLILQYNP